MELPASFFVGRKEGKGNYQMRPFLFVLGGFFFFEGGRFGESETCEYKSLTDRPGISIACSPVRFPWFSFIFSVPWSL
jgi:hypothetical protein